MERNDSGPRLTRGNSKLGRAIWGWSIPAGDTCPGRSAACRVCYAMRGQYRRPSVAARLRANHRASLEPTFAGRMIREIDRVGARVVRIHVAGDFYGASYVGAWYLIAATRPAVHFYAYTRSWRVPGLRSGLHALSALPNVGLWYSADADTGAPQDVPPGVRVAWLQERSQDAVPAADLIFRDSAARDTPAKRIGLTLVCPVESATPAAQTTCSACRVCWYQ